MPFPRQLLNQNEEIVLDVHPHWLFFTEPALASLGFLIVVIIAAAAGISWLTYLALIALAVTLLWALWRLVTWRSMHFVITNDRLIYRSGVFAKRGIQIPLERVNNVNFRQGILERVVGAGDLLVESAGEDGQQRFTDVRHPDQIQNLIHHQMNENENRQYAAAAGAGAAAAGMAPSAIDTATQLEKLEGMLQRGTLTREEFEAEKRRLIGGGPLPPPTPPPPSAGR